MENLIHYFRFDRRMRRKTFIKIMIIYWILGAALTLSMAPNILTGQTATPNYLEIIRATPINYYVLGMLATILVIPAYAARLMDMAVPPFFAVLFLFESVVCLVIKNGVDLPHEILIASGLIFVVAKIILVIRRGTKGSNHYGPDPVP